MCVCIIHSVQQQFYSVSNRFFYFSITQPQSLFTCYHKIDKPTSRFRCKQKFTYSFWWEPGYWKWILSHQMSAKKKCLLFKAVCDVQTWWRLGLLDFDCHNKTRMSFVCENWEFPLSFVLNFELNWFFLFSHTAIV